MSLTSAMQALIASSLEDMRVCIPARVQSYNHGNQTASVVPLVRRRYKAADGSTKTRTPAPILNVPVAFPGGGEVSITFPLSPGDTVLLVFADTSIDEWKASGGTVDPVDGRSHSATDAIAYPMARVAGRALQGLPAGTMRIGRAGPAHIDITSNQIMAGGNSPLITRAEFLDHTHPAPGGATSPPSNQLITGTVTLKGG